MSPRIAEEPWDTSVQPVCVLERGCNPELFWNVHSLVLPALQQELTLLTLAGLSRLKGWNSGFLTYFWIQARCLSGSFMHRSISCISLTFPVPPIPCISKGWAGSGLAAGAALAVLEMEAVQGGSTRWELCWDLGDCSSGVPIATGVSCWFLEEAGATGRARLRCKHVPGWVRCVLWVLRHQTHPRLPVGLQGTLLVTWQMVMGNGDWALLSAVLFSRTQGWFECAAALSSAWCIFRMLD